MSNIGRNIILGQRIPSNDEVHASMNLLSDDELTSVHAIASYKASECKASEAFVLFLTADRFSVDDVSKIRRCNYDDAVHYMIDLNLATIIN